ncbi:ethanolamine utilization ethanol dehydrogenase EutG [Escherichia coli]
MQKNVAQARGTPGVECLSPQVLTGDNGLTLIENAPWGVVASVTPSTNPAATVINNAISLIAAGNSVIFAPHPAAKKVSQRAITLLNQAIVAAGGPENLLVTVANPDIETAQRLFKFPGIGLLVVTGGEAVVEAARKHTNKRLIAAGAGNPPVVVDETADLARAAQSIVKGASFDNNIICADEKVLIVVDSVADELMRLMEGQHAVKLTAEQAQQLQPVLLKNIDERGKGTVSRDWVGRDAAKIAAAIGLNVPQETRLLFVETTAEHPFAVTELMMPVLPVVRVANVADAIALAVKLEGGCHHTAAMHSRNIENMNQMANAIDTSIFVKNGPCITDVCAAVAQLRESGCDGVIAFGGGSVLDAAKAVALLVTNPDSTLAEMSETSVLQPRLPLIAIPTTAGTGSETTNVTVIIDAVSGRKQVLAHASLMPDVAILDAALTEGVPSHVTAMTGIDALTHAIEAYSALNATPFTDSLAIGAIAMIGKSLPKAVGYGHDLAARESMLLASCMAGMAFSSAGLGLCHAMAHQPGAALHIPHGLANAMLLPTVMEFNRMVCRERFSQIGRALRTKKSDDRDAINAVSELIAEVRIGKRLGDVGATSAHYGAWAQAALEDICLRSNPRTASLEQIVGLYAAAQ